MNKKCFAALMSALDLTRQIQKLTNDVLTKPNGCTQAYNTIKKIAELNDKYIHDFGTVDPYWKPADASAQANTAVAKQTSPESEFTDEQYNARFAATFNQYSAQKSAASTFDQYSTQKSPASTFNQYSAQRPAANTTVAEKTNSNSGGYSDLPLPDTDEDGGEIYE